MCEETLHNNKEESEILKLTVLQNRLAEILNLIQLYVTFLSFMFLEITCVLYMVKRQGTKKPDKFDSSTENFMRNCGLKKLVYLTVVFSKFLRNSLHIYYTFPCYV